MMMKNSRVWLSIVFAALVSLSGSRPASAQHYGYGDWYGPRYGYPHGYWYGYGYDPYYGPHASESQAATNGRLELQVTPKTSIKAQVYIDGALASEFKRKQCLWLAPGTHRIEVHREGYQSQSHIIYVTVGKTLKLHFILTPSA
jgi:hypothetical protein